ncbi:MAG: hypothetical protein VYC34_05875, partial [Planctomycetota bacterium]|nr:hypothetical protein [Planctomycetota bacterium]
MIRTDRPCASCGYNLKGLLTNTRCPECGAFISLYAPKLPTDSLAQTPVPYIRLITAGAILLTIAAACVPPLMVLVGYGWMKLPAFAFAIIAALWCAGVAILCMPRPAPPVGRTRDSNWLALRIATIATQPFWLILAAAAIIGPTALPPGATPSTFVMLCITIAFFGLAPFIWMLADVALWADELSVAARIRMAGYWMMIITLLSYSGVTFRIPLPIVFGGIDLV